jgi:hypothetical protein
MALMLEIEIDESKLDKGFIHEVKRKDGSILKLYKLTVSVEDEVRYGKNVSAYYKQTEEEKNKKARRTYIANGKVFWHNGRVLTSKEAEGGQPSSRDTGTRAPAQDDEPDVPF